MGERKTTSHYVYPFPFHVYCLDRSPDTRLRATLDDPQRRLGEQQALFAPGAASISPLTVDIPSRLYIPVRIVDVRVGNRHRGILLLLLMVVLVIVIEVGRDEIVNRRLDLVYPV
jgi:hypothetical protein